MSKKTTNQATAEPQATQQKDQPTPPSPEQQLVEIRDLLFGEQQQAIQQRIDRLERNMQKKLQEMSDMFSTALNNLSKECSNKIEDLASHVEDLNRQHTHSEHMLASDISDLQHDLSDTRKELQQADSEIDAHLNAEANRLMSELTQKYNEMMANLKATSEELKNNKADRKTLATLLASVANNLNEDE